jgi:hypothetical protein
LTWAAPHGYRRAVTKSGILLALALALVATAPALGADYGRWRVQLSATVDESWSASSAAPCALNGGGAARMTISSKPLVTRLRWTRRSGRIPATWWTGSSRHPIKDMRVHVDASDSASAVRNPPASPDDTCQWPDPATYSCGARSYDGHLTFGGGVRGVALDGSPPDIGSHEPEAQTCGPAADTDFTVMQISTPTLGPVFRVSRRRASKRRRMVLREHACGDRTANYDNTPYDSFDVRDRRCRDSALTLSPVR